MPPAPTTMELARLYGIREDDPKRYRVVQASDSALKELAQFFSHYFPRLLKILHDGPPARLIYDITLHLLFHISKANLPQFTRALHRFEDASDLPTLVAKHFVHFPSTYLDDLSTANAKARNPSRDLHLLLSLVRSSINFNPAASKLNFHLDPSLLADLAQRGNHFLSTPYLQNASDDDDDEKAATLKRRLVSVLSTFGLMDLGNEKFAKQREEMLKSGGESEEIEVFGRRERMGTKTRGCCLGDIFVQPASAWPTAPLAIRRRTGRNTSSSATSPFGRTSKGVGFDRGRRTTCFSKAGLSVGLPFTEGVSEGDALAGARSTRGLDGMTL